MITVSKDGSGDFTSVQEAVNAAAERDIIFIKNGVYRERVEITKPFLTIEGESAENTVIESSLGAYEILGDGLKRGTFRTYTMLVNADNFICRNITAANRAGFGKDVGQAIAVYAEGDMISFFGCRILGRQDTLFTGPLPHKEIEKGGFRGPTEFSPRRTGRQLYRDCYIEGDVDFIFGSAAAYFDGCELFSLDRGEEINGYVTAASTFRGEKYGYVFRDCKFTGNCPEGTVYLGRPWRNYARTVLLDCDIGAHINPAAFHDWNKTEARDTVFYALHSCRGEGFSPEKLAPFVKILSDAEAEEYSPEKILSYRPHALN